MKSKKKKKKKNNARTRKKKIETLEVSDSDKLSKPKITGRSFCKRNENVYENKKNGKVKLNETIEIFQDLRFEI